MAQWCGCVELVGVGVDAVEERRGIGQRRLLGAAHRLGQQVLDVGRDLVLLAVGERGVLAEPVAEALDRVALRPLLEHLAWARRRRRRGRRGPPCAASGTRSASGRRRRAPSRSRASPRGRRRARRCRRRRRPRSRTPARGRRCARRRTRGASASSRPTGCCRRRRRPAGAGRRRSSSTRGVSPRADAPSPNQPSATRRSSRIRKASAQPTATGSIAGRWLTIEISPSRASAMWTLPSRPCVGPSARPM